MHQFKWLYGDVRFTLGFAIACKICLILPFIAWWKRKNPVIRTDLQDFAFFCLNYWRRKRDSNPRSARTDNGFQDRRIRPLCHSSGRKSSKILKCGMGNSEMWYRKMSWLDGNLNKVCRTGLFRRFGRKRALGWNFGWY